MKTKWAKIIGVLLILSGVVFCYGGWDNTKPADNQAWNDAAGSIRDNWDALEVVLGVNLVGVGGGIPYYQATAPTTKPDGSTAIDVNDNGRLWIDSDDGLLYNYKYASSGTVWWPLIDVVNIKQLGAVGDNSNDDTSAIQAAIDAVPSGGGILYLPPGTYKTTATLNGKAYMEMVFAAGAEIAYTGSEIALDFHDATRGLMKQVTIRRPRITATNGTCLRLSGFHQCVIIEPYLAGKIGIKLLDGNTARIIGGGEIKKDGTDREAGSIGIDISDTTAAINDIIIDITHIWEYEKGIQIGPSDYSQSTNGIAITAAFEFNKDAIYINTGVRHTIENCWFEAQTRAAIYIDNNGSANPPSRLVFLSNTFNETDSVYNIYSVNYGEIHIVTPVVGAGIFSYGANTKVNLIGASIGITTLANEATPTVLNGKIFVTGGTTTITDFDDGVEAQEITIIAEHSLTITDSTNIFLNGSSNWAMIATDTLTLIQKANGLWYETSRGDNG